MAKPGGVPARREKSNAAEGSGKGGQEEGVDNQQRQDCTARCQRRPAPGKSPMAAARQVDRDAQREPGDVLENEETRDGPWQVNAEYACKDKVADAQCQQTEQDMVDLMQTPKPVE